MIHTGSRRSVTDRTPRSAASIEETGGRVAVESPPSPPPPPAPSIVSHRFATLVAGLSHIHRVGVLIENPVDQLFLASYWKTSDAPKALPTWSQWVRYLKFENKNIVSTFAGLMMHGGHAPTLSRYVRIVYNTQFQDGETYLVQLGIAHSDKLEDLLVGAPQGNEGSVWLRQSETPHYYDWLGAAGKWADEFWGWGPVTVKRRFNGVSVPDSGVSKDRNILALKLKPVKPVRPIAKAQGVTSPTISVTRNRYSKEQLINALRALAKELKRTPTMTDMDVEIGTPSSVAYKNKFGSWNAAIQAAGLTPNDPKGKVKKGKRAEGLISFLSGVVTGVESATGVTIAPDMDGLKELQEAAQGNGREGFTQLDGEMCKVEPLITLAELKPVKPLEKLPVQLKDGGRGFEVMTVDWKKISTPPSIGRLASALPAREEGPFLAFATLAIGIVAFFEGARFMRVPSLSPAMPCGGSFLEPNEDWDRNGA